MNFHLLYSLDTFCPALELLAHEMLSKIFNVYTEVETMRFKYEHRPGLFGLASIALGCAAKDLAERTQRDSTSATDGTRKTESRLKSRTKDRGQSSKSS